MGRQHLDWEHWAIDDVGRVRRVVNDAEGEERARGWIDPGAGVGGIDQVAGEPAEANHLPSELLDLLERRYPGVRWFVPARRAA